MNRSEKNDNFVKYSQPTDIKILVCVKVTCKCSEKRIYTEKLYVWFKHKSLGDTISLPMLTLGKIYLDQKYSWLDSRISYFT